MTGARTCRARRVAQALPVVATLHAHGADCDSTWWARRSGRNDWFELTTPLSVNDRGDTPTNESNFAVAQSRIAAASAFDLTYRYDLWPGGTIRTLTVRCDDAAALRELDTVLAALADYAVLDEEDLAQREWEENHPDGGDRQCYSDPDCSCDYRTHQHVLHVRDNGDTCPWCEVCDQDIQEWDPDRYDHRDPRPLPPHPQYDQAQIELFAT